jgi:sugar transferase EpsL
MRSTLSFFGAMIAALLLILLVPLTACIAVLAAAGTRRPPIFRQRRTGQNGRAFTIYKFRTMSDLRDDKGRLRPDEQRLTRVGRFLRSTSLDELPQLWNVLKGDMCFVGPRPLLPEYLPRYSAHQRRRHEVKPGLTGWAQVNGRNALTWEQKFDIDVWYVDHRSLWLDLKILWMTLRKVLLREGIGRQGYATMPEFLGSTLNAGPK